VSTAVLPRNSWIMDGIFAPSEVRVLRKLAAVERRIAQAASAGLSAGCAMIRSLREPAKMSLGFNPKVLRIE
jgi:hypothetical protein